MFPMRDMLVPHSMSPACLGPSPQGPSHALLAAPNPSLRAPLVVLSLIVAVACAGATLRTQPGWHAAQVLHTQSTARWPPPAPTTRPANRPHTVTHKGVDTDAHPQLRPKAPVGPTPHSTEPPVPGVLALGAAAGPAALAQALFTLSPFSIVLWGLLGGWAAYLHTQHQRRCLAPPPPGPRPLGKPCQGAWDPAAAAAPVETLPSPATPWSLGLAAVVGVKVDQEVDGMALLPPGFILKKKKDPLAELPFAWARIIFEKAKAGDVGLAYHTFEDALGQGASVSPDGCQTLMAFLTGDREWVEVVRRSNQPGQTDLLDPSLADVLGAPCTAVPRSAFSCVETVYQYLQSKRGQNMDTATVMLARAYAFTGDPWTAEALALALPDASLRHFVVPLTAWASRRDYERALPLFQEILVRKLQVGQPEFALLLEACRGGAPYDIVANVLMMMQDMIEGSLDEAIVEQLQGYFETVEDCVVRTVSVRPDGGFSSGCAGNQRDQKLQLMTVPVPDVQAMMTKVEEIVIAGSRNQCTPEHQERNSQNWDTFKGWIEKHQPYDAVIDGANVALLCQNYTGGYFRWCSIRKAIEALRQELGVQRPLVVLHFRRLQNIRQEDRWVQDFVEDLKRNNQLFVTRGGNDDWYWSWMAMRCNAYVASNDDLRDLLFSLLEFPYFERWYRQHRVTYTMDEDWNLQLEKPLMYTLCAQCFDDCWMIPKMDGEWMQIQWLGSVEDAQQSEANQNTPDLTKMTVVDLKAELRKRGLSLSGLKETLVERLSAARAEEAGTVLASPDVPAQTGGLEIVGPAEEAEDSDTVPPQSQSTAAAALSD
uniref:ribonuclease P n=1 Tax=Eutreptiella gymnastica TaxID=73025 RepID=A0A7S1JEP1_9EUGL